MSLDDERVRFYLKHRDQIEEWAALRGEAATAIDEWLEGLKDDVDQLARDLGSGVRVTVALDQPWPIYRLMSPAWRVDDAGENTAAVALEWQRGRTTMRERLSPYVGVRAPRVQPAGAAIRASDTFRGARVARKDESSPWWAAYRYVPPGETFPLGLDEYRADLINALRTCWSVYAPILDDVLGGG